MTLAAAQVIRDKLSATGRYHVILTRDRDITVPHKARIDIGRQAQADLFISVHADSIHDPSVRGATVYTLSEGRQDKEAERLSKMENQADIISGVDVASEPDEVSDILIDLAMRETMNLSARFAGFLVPELEARVEVRNNTHRFGSLKVLTAPDVPSVLLETGYLSNRQDARFLASARGKARIAEAVTAAVDRYFAAMTAQNF